MDSGAQFNWLEDGRRLHLQHGPIDLIVEANGASKSVQSAYQQAIDAFQFVLPDLVNELDFLRRPLRSASGCPRGIVAKKMHVAAMRFVDNMYVTPMIAVAGSVADYILQVMLAGGSLQRAYVNNGGDIALYLDEDQHFDIGICNNTDTGSIASTLRLKTEDGIGGIATSGWRGRSYSLGIADAVTVLACNAASADTAATIIANVVDIPESPYIVREAANELSLDSDLGDMQVTVSVETLSDVEIQCALQHGKQRAHNLITQGLIDAAFISLQSESVVCGNTLNDTLSDWYRPCTKLNQIGANYA